MNNNDDLPPISPERWRDKFSSEPSEIIPAPPGVPEVLEELRTGKLSAAAAEVMLVQLGFEPLSAQLTVKDHLEEWKRSGGAKNTNYE